MPGDIETTKDPQTADDDFMSMVNSHNKTLLGDKAQGGQVVGDSDQSDVQDGTDPSLTDAPPTDAPPTDPSQTDQDEVEGDPAPIIENPLDGQDLQSKPRKKNKQENIKNLRESLKTEKLRAVDLGTELEEARSKLKDVETREEQIEEQSARIKELEKYEDLSALYKEPGFQEEYFESVADVVLKANGIATEYDVKEEVITAALKISNRRELNSFLGKHFDQLGVQDVRKYILEAQDIAVERHKMEQNPRQAREMLITRMENTKQQRITNTMSKLKVRMANSWEATLGVYSDDDSGLPMFKQDIGNKEHTKTRKQIVGVAESEFTKVINALAGAGATDIPEPLMRAMASRFQLSQATGHLYRQNNELQQEVTELKAELDKTNKYSRPLSNGTGSGRVAPKSDQIDSEDIAAHVMNRAMEAERS